MPALIRGAVAVKQGLKPCWVLRGPVTVSYSIQAFSGMDSTMPPAERAGIPRSQIPLSVKCLCQWWAARCPSSRDFTGGTKPDGTLCPSMWCRSHDCTLWVRIQARQFVNPHSLLGVHAHGNARELPRPAASPGTGPWGPGWLASLPGLALPGSLRGPCRAPLSQLHNWLPLKSYCTVSHRLAN